jgi:hypothetical protein
MNCTVVYETSLVIAICVVSIFLFPATQGPYPVVHGPATTLRAARAFTQIEIGITSALSAVCSRTFVSRPVSSDEEFGDINPRFLARHGTKDILRC